MKQTKLPAKFTPAQIECLCALLGWTNTGNALKITGDEVDFQIGINGKEKLSKVNVNTVYWLFPAESDEMADGFKFECYFFKPDLTEKNAVKRCLKCWPDVVEPVLKYVK